MARGRRLFLVLALFGALLLPVHAGVASTPWRDIDLNRAAAPSESLAAPQFVTADGIHHAVFNRPRNGGLVYGRCTSRCDDRLSWTTVSLPTFGRGLHVGLAVTPGGGPRLAWYAPDEEGVRYASCDSACTTASSWTLVTLAGVDDDVSGTGGGGVSISYDVDVAMALDSRGWPAVVYTRPGSPAELVYARCLSGCTSAASWAHVVLETTADGGYTPAGPELVFHQDNPILVFHRLVEGAKPLIKTCTQLCLDAASWTTSEINAPYMFEGDLQFDGERAGLVYAVAKKRASSQNVSDSWLVYLSCEQQCTDGTRWSPAVVFDDVGDQFTYADYATWSTGRHYHSANRPRLQWMDGRPRVTYASCVDCGLDTEESHVFLASCDGSCTQRVNWSVEDLKFTGPQALAPTPVADGMSLRFLYTRYRPGETDGSLFLAWCDASCGSPPSVTPPPSSTTTTSSTTTSTSTTVPSTTATTTAPQGNDPAHAPSTPVLVSPADGASLYYGQPEKFTLRSSDPDGDPYKTIVVVRKAMTGEIVGTYESALTLSGLEASAKPNGPLAPGTYEWTARSVDVTGLGSRVSSSARFTVQ